jgi:hypothetical protein
VEDTCTKCNNTCDISFFVKDNSRKLGYRRTCKTCHSSSARELNLFKKVEKENSDGKNCFTCREFKTWSNFSSKNGFVCKECRIVSHKIQNKNKRKHYSKEDYNKAKNKICKKQNIKRNERKVYFIRMLGGKCIDCNVKYGEKHPSCIFDFHHLDPTKKDINIARFIKSKKKEDIVLNEITKCVLLCSNCHRIRHCKINVDLNSDLD